MAIRICYYIYIIVLRYLDYFRFFLNLIIQPHVYFFSVALTLHINMRHSTQQSH